MKYALQDGEIMIHQRDADIYLPLSVAEAQHVVDVMNSVTLTEKQLVVRLDALVTAPSDMIERAEALLDSDDKPE